ncbi:MAG: sensor histidine kinase [Pyrinomonadaceae bacterium]
MPASTSATEFVVKKLLIFWALLSFVGLLLLASYYIGRTSSGQSFQLLDAINSQLLRFQVWAAMAYLIIGADRFFRTIGQRWIFLFPAHLLASFFWSAASLAIFGLAFWALDGLGRPRTMALGSVFSIFWLQNTVMGIFIYKIILTTSYALDYYHKFNEERSRNDQLEKELAQAELKALKMQLQPHFLFNTLNSISHLALEDPRKAVQTIARLGDFLRLTIENNGQHLVSFEREMEFLRNYLEIEKIRFKDRMTVNFDISDDILDVRVPNLIMQPFVENAIKHGLAKRLAAGRIDIMAARAGERLRIEISNDGEVIDLNANGKNQDGLGFQNSRDRLEKLYGSKYSLRLEPNPSGGATVSVEIPLGKMNGGRIE